MTLARICQRVIIYAISDFINVSEEIQHVLVKIKTETRFVYLNLVQYVFMFKVKLWLFRLTHHLIRQLLCFSSFGINSLVVEEFSKCVKNSERVIFRKLKLLLLSRVIFSPLR